MDGHKTKPTANSSRKKDSMNYKHLSDIELEKTLKDSVQEENKLKIQILHLLAEVERRRLYSKQHPSLFEYCVKVLKYSSAAAQRRIDSMRAMKLIPELEEKIISGELNLSSISQAQSFFRRESKQGKAYSIEQKKEVLEKLENKSSRECIQELITISPQSVPQEKRRELTPEKTELKVVLNKDLIEKLDKIKALMSHKNPNMTDQELIEVMAEALLQRIDPEEKAKRIEARKKQANDAQILPASEVKSKNPRYIPAAMKMDVYMKYKGKCSHVNCNSRKFLEYDHIQPLALGGKTTLNNLRLLCRAHNQRAAINLFGAGKIQKYLKDTKTFVSLK